MRGRLDYECGSEFIDENGGRSGVQLRKRHRKKGRGVTGPANYKTNPIY